jgi:hypothetical protein
MFAAALLVSQTALAELANDPAKAEPSKPAGAAEHVPHDQPRADDRSLDIGVLGGIGFPRPLAIEPVVGLGRTVMIGVEGSALPTTTVGGVGVRMWGVAGDVRLFPFRGAFFVGLRGGYQQISGDATLTATGIGSYTESVEVGTWFVNPRVGFLWVAKPFAIGLDAGLQVPIATTVSRSSLLFMVSPQADAQITTTTNLLGRSVLPTLDLLRVGLVF